MEHTSPSLEKELLTRGITEVIDRSHLEERLRHGDRLRLKLGIDPTGARLHLGHAVPLRILRRFQDLGHTVVLIIGDFTASIGDPSGKSETRPPLSSAEIKRNYATYGSQAFRILDRKKTEVKWQSEWFGKMKLRDVVEEASKLSAGWIYSHETFRERLKSGRALALHETLYPLLQAYDSVVVRADVEIGGLDQKFNLLTGRALMKSHGLEAQDIILTKYLIGTDGQKMGKSLGNYIALEEEPFEMFGKIMRLPDEVLRDYLELAADVPLDDIAGAQLTDIAARDAKLKLAEHIVRLYHSPSKSQAARKKWDAYVKGTTLAGVVRLRDVPKGSLLEFLTVTRIAKSKSEAQRLIQQGGVILNDAIVKDWRKGIAIGDTITVGKKKRTYTVEA